MDILLAFAVMVAVMAAFFGVFLIVGTKWERRFVRKEMERRAIEDRKMFEARLRGELYIPQPGAIR